MRKLLILIIILTFASACYADIQRINKMPQGTFKKARNGKIIQYDSNGKKIGVYNLNNERYLIRNEKKLKH